MAARTPAMRALIILKLVEAGRLSLDASFAEALPLNAFGYGLLGQSRRSDQEA